jgi:hypothetical protein
MFAIAHACLVAAVAAQQSTLEFTDATGSCSVTKTGTKLALSSGCDLSVTKDGETTSLLSLKADIAAAIATLQQKIDDIALTPGPKGDKGDDGAASTVPGAQVTFACLQSAHSIATFCTR